MIALALALATMATAQPAAPTAVGVGLQEWRVAVYRPRVRARRVRFNVTNLGEDTHDLVVRAPGGRVLRRIGPIAAGGHRRAVVRLRKPGRYVLYCDIADHQQRGMRAWLRVTSGDGASR